MKKIKEDVLQIIELLNCLTLSEVVILNLRFGGKKTIYECGKIMRITPERVRQIEEKAIMKLIHGK